MNHGLFHSDIVSTDRIIYTPSKFASSSLLYLQEIGKLTAQKQHISKRSNLSSYLFFIVENGSGTLHYNRTEYFLKKDSCVFIDCNNIYQHETSKDLWSLKWIHFQGFSMKNIYSKYLERGGLPVFTPQDITPFFDTWETLFSDALSHDYLRDMHINEELSHLLTLLMQESWHPLKQTPSNATRTIESVKAYIDENFQQKITLDNLSERYFINKYYLTRLFKDNYGMSVITYVNQLRITHAKQLLRFSDMPLEQIAYACGFESGYYFSKCFKKIEGITPSDYRKKW